MQVTIDGKPLTVSWKGVALAVALSVGGFTGGASFPELNPLSLFSEGCSE
jgi:hypothetical protein